MPIETSAHSLPVEALALAYMRAKEHVIYAGYADEIDWQESIRFSLLTESDFLREAAWVVLSAGMAEAVIRRKFPAFSKAFKKWRSAKRIHREMRACSDRALKIFAHHGKVDAVGRIVSRVHMEGFAHIKAQLSEHGVEYIRTFPYMGQVTAFHLAKNIGLDVVKPDRHLTRMARVSGCGTPDLLCRAIACIVGDSLATIDLVLWRFATLQRNYEGNFAFHAAPLASERRISG